MLKVLLINYYRGVFSRGKTAAETTRRKRYLLTRCIAIFVFLFLSATMSLSLGYLLNEHGNPEAMPALFMAISSIMVLVTTIYKINGTLFGFTDYDTLASMPIPSRTLIASRLIVLYFLNIGLCLILMVPAGIVYAIMTSPGPLYYVFYILGMLLVPVLPIAIATIIGTIITAISSRFTHKNIIGTIIMLIGFIAYFILCFSLNSVIKTIVSISDIIINQINTLYPPCMWFTSAACHLDIMSFVYFALLSLAVAAIYTVVTSKLFARLNSGMQTSGRSKKKYQMGELTTSTPMRALIKKETKKYFSSTMLIMNTGIGIVISVIACVALALFGSQALSSFIHLPEGTNISIAFASLAPFALSFMFAMFTYTASSISLEGKCFYILRTLPITSKAIINSKLLFSLLLPLPFLILDCIILWFIIPMTFVQAIFMFVTPLVLLLFESVLGLRLNIAYPKFDWTTEVTVIKQGAPMMYCTFINLGLTFLPLMILGGTGWLLYPAVLPIYTAVILIVTIVIARSLYTKGAKKLEDM